MQFVLYLDTWAAYFGSQLNGPLEFLAFTTRNLLEFNLVLPVAFKTAESRALFLSEALRLDVNDLHTRLSACFTSIVATLPERGVEDIEWLPESNARLNVKRDVFDAWLHKFCSKLIKTGGSTASSRAWAVLAGVRFLFGCET